IAHQRFSANMIDKPLLRELLSHWEQRFKTATPSHGNVALFRSLNMAVSAAMLPGNVEVTIYDVGKAVALWVSAFEILAHTGNTVGYRQVYELLEKSVWNLMECNTATYEPYGYKVGQSKRILPVWLYGELNRARN